MKNITDLDGSAPREVLLAARERATQVKETVTEEASRAVESIKLAASEQMAKGKSELAESLKSVDEALRRTSSEMEDSPLAPQVEKVADAVAHAHQFIETHGMEDIGVAVRRLSLLHPVIFYSSIFALGFAAGRFLSSTETRAPELPDYDINLLDEDLDANNQTLSQPLVSHHGPY